MKTLDEVCTGFSIEKSGITLYLLDYDDDGNTYLNFGILCSNFLKLETKGFLA
jgi:hypothetical protein